MIRRHDIRSRWILIALAGMIFQCGKVQDKNTPLEWSVRMADSVMKRSPQPWTIDFRDPPRWDYQYGLVLHSILDTWEATGNESYFQYVKTYYDRYVDSNGNIETYKLQEYNIDRLNSGKPLFRLYKKTGEEKYRKALMLLREQMKTHPRTSEGGFWHKKVYPYQMWLDGLYMGSPFLAEFAQTFNEPQIFDDVAGQFILMEKHARDSTSGLLHHGWDESLAQKWADPVTGRSPCIWGRGMGWYAMGLVDVLDFLPADHPERQSIIAILRRLASAILKVQDTKTGLWYQVLDQGERQGNYLESSASSMFVYALTKGVRNGYLEPSFLKAATNGYDGIIRHFIGTDTDGLTDIHQGCAVAGLGGDPYRDGSYEYYVHEKIRTNDPKAVGPFIMAGIEFEKLRKSQEMH